MIKSAPKNYPDLSDFDYSSLEERFKLHEIFTRTQDQPNTLKPELREKIEVLNKEDAIVLKDLITNEAHLQKTNI